jgi:hypothetical protein
LNNLSLLNFSLLVSNERSPVNSLFNPWIGALWLAALGLGACTDAGSEASPQGPGEVSASGNTDAANAAGNDAAQWSSGALVYRSAVAPVSSVDQALPGTFIPPFEDCRTPAPGDVASRPDGKVCTNVAISACTEEGKYFPNYAACDVVRRQRPYWAAPPAKASRADDPRLQDQAFLAESAWASAQIGSSGCTCCHDSRVVPASQWDISLGPLWIDSISDTGLALFVGLADSTVLGAYPAADNHGFDRDKTGIPTTDTARMKAFAMAELRRRGRDEAWAGAVPPFGGPIYANSIKQPGKCEAGQGIDTDGSVRWTSGPGRYVYVLTPGSKNPGVPPNLDLPAGTLWRLDVLASAQALAPGIRFGETPAGSVQSVPASSPAPPLERGKSYQLVVLLDVGVPLVNCLFEFGQSVALDAGASSAPDAGAAYADAGSGYPTADAGASEGGAAAGMCTLAGGDTKGFGAPCNDTTMHSDCSCAANYCSKSPFDTQGYCSVIGCKENPAICPTGWSCFDVSVFAAGQPSVCMKP